MEVARQDTAVEHAHLEQLRPLGDTGSHLRSGWPKHHGMTMRWVTQRELDEEAGTR